MAKKKKYGHDKLLTDWKHWLGWAITTGAIVGVFHLLGVHAIHTPWWHVGVVGAVVVVIDVIKHFIKLQ